MKDVNKFRFVSFIIIWHVFQSVAHLHCFWFAMAVLVAIFAHFHIGLDTASS